MALSHIAANLPRALNKAGIAQQVQASVVLEHFRKLIAQEFGQQVAKEVEPISLKDGVLRVRCGSNVLASEVRLREGKFREGLQRKYGKGVVERISVRR